jgi:CRISPR-associated protein Cas1
MIKRTLFIGNPARLKIRKEQLVIELHETDKCHQVPLEDVGIILIEHPQTSLTHAVLQQSMRYNIALINCDDKHMPQGIMLPLEGHVELRARYQEQLDASLPLKKQLWAQTIRAKLRNQAAHLASRGQQASRLEHLAREVQSGDTSNCEGQGAAIYWAALINGNEPFIRDRSGEPPNNVLNYGYAILRAMVARALIGRGLLLAIGIHHLNKYNAFCLADDIMEPYRPFVDEVACQLMDEGFDNLELSLAVKKRILMLPQRDVEIEHRRMPMWNGIIRTAQSLQRCFAGSARNLWYPVYAPVSNIPA